MSLNTFQNNYSITDRERLNMAVPNSDVQAIEKISAVVGESQVQIILSDQYIKAQAFLVNRLKRQFKHQKEVSKFISSDNLKLEAEIKNAEQEIKSLMLAHETIKAANVELKKEWHLAKETTQETVERIQIGEKKYDELWEQCKSIYESIGFVQNWLQAKKKNESFEENISGLDKETQGILDEIQTKNRMVSELNKKRIIQLAEFFVHERPKTLEKISILSKELKELNSQVEKFKKSQVVEEARYKEAMAVDAGLRAQEQRLNTLKIDDGWPNLNKNRTSNVNTLMPQLQIMSVADLDVMSVKLDQIKNYGSRNASPMKEVTLEPKTINPVPKLALTPDKGHNEYVSLYFHKSADVPSTSDPTQGNSFNYSKRKLINILEDIKLDKTDTYSIVSKVNVENLKGVSVITANVKKLTPSEATSEKNKDNAQDEEIEELDLTSSNVEQIILPPSGFLDQLRNSQEKKKKVSFELPTSAQEDQQDDTKGTPNTPKDNVDGENDVTVTTNSPLNDSEESFTRIKDMILKKHNLDLSPPFVYSKNTATFVKNDEVVKSNYFKLSCEEHQPSTSEADTRTVQQPNEVNENEIDCEEPVEAADFINTNKVENNVEMELGENIISSAKAPGNQEQIIAKPVDGLLFSHGPLGIPDSLDISISTTGFEDGDADYPQYSSLLLSPKADLPIPSTSENAGTEVISQDVPNFLSGLRKTGLSFFGKMTGTNCNTDNANAPTGQNNFNFAFGSDEKKNRGGLFNMFN